MKLKCYSVLAALFAGVIYAQQSFGQSALPTITNNPSRPLVTPLAGKAKSPSYTLQALLLSPKRQWAQINGKLLKVGQRLGNYTLIDIKQDRAVLQSAGSTLVLKLPKKTNFKTLSRINSPFEDQ